MLGLVVGALAIVPAAIAPSAFAAPPKTHKTNPKKGPGHDAGKGAKAASKAPSAAIAPAAPKAAEPAAPIELKLDLHRATLANGLRVVVDVDHTSPTVAISVTYDVGARNEVKGRSGFAHLFEHMMFQGSRNVPKGDHFKLISGHGGVLNGTTNSDRTNYFEVLPENELALGLWLEADRMRSLDVSQENFENQRKVVQEEYRMRVSNAAYVPSSIRLEELVYQGYFPYEHPTIGSMADLDAAKIEWVREFHAEHYGPNNAVLAIAGDVDAEAAMALVHRYFDDVPKVAAPKYVDVPLPEQTSERTAVMKDDHARTPAVRFGWAIPPARSADHYALDMAGVVLADGESSRLHQLLVREKGLALSVGAHTGQARGPDAFRINATLASGAKPAEVEKLIEAEIKTFATRGPTDAELRKARSQVESGFVLGLSANLSRARQLAEYELYFGDAGLLAGELPRYAAVTADDVKRAVAQYLGPTRRSIVVTYPSDAAVPDTKADKPADKPAAKAASAPPPEKGSKKGAAAKPKSGKQKKP